MPPGRDAPARRAANGAPAAAILSTPAVCLSSICAPSVSYAIAVRELCSFTAKAGDLDHRFTPSPSSEEGLAGHRLVASRRGAGYRAEVSLQKAHEELLVRGRADGFDQQQALVEEVKTFRGQLANMPANQRALHWAQAKVYGAMLCQDVGLAGLTVRLVYLDIDSGEETHLDESCNAAELAAFFELQCRRFLAWARREIAHRAERDAALLALGFAYPEFRSGQRRLAEQAYLAASRGRLLMAQAGTGIGKTLATLYATLKAAPQQRIDKVFFLTAKGSGHGPPLEAIDQLAAAPLRVLQLTARAKACEHPDKACHGESCPLARGFYDRLPEARSQAAEAGRLEAADLRRIALEHSICPYYLAQETARWADVIVADYNYLFDVSALLHGLTLANGWRVALLVDEAHNLVERGRAMYSATLSRDELRTVARTAPAALRKPLQRLSRAWPAIEAASDANYQASDELPARFMSAAGDVCTAVGDLLVEDPIAVPPPLLDLHFELLHFRRLAESFGPHSFFDITRLPGRTRSELGLRNAVPAPFLKPRLAAMSSAVLFSATLQPQAFYADMLGLPEDTAWLDVAPPFVPEQLDVHVVTEVSTRFASRAASARPIARIIASQFHRAPGNYIAFFSSFDYLELVAQQLQEFAEVPTWRQHRSMTQADRDEFLARFTPEGAGVALAVLGGSFAEGVDLPGTRLIGAFIATLGLPQLNPVNEQMRRSLDRQHGAGFEYTYLYPGLRKVVQAAGRVIRSPEDTGTLYLIDERFRRPQVRELLPRWWRLPAANGSCAVAADTKPPAPPASKATVP
jgi:DNA excision repair protein ERCC-2